MNESREGANYVRAQAELAANEHEVKVTGLNDLLEERKRKIAGLEARIKELEDTATRDNGMNLRYTQILEKGIEEYRKAIEDRDEEIETLRRRISEFDDAERDKDRAEAQFEIARGQERDDPEAPQPVYEGKGATPDDENGPDPFADA